MHMNFHLAFDKEGVPEDKRETVFRYGEQALFVTPTEGARWTLLYCAAPCGQRVESSSAAMYVS